MALNWLLAVAKVWRAHFYARVDLWAEHHLRHGRLADLRHPVKHEWAHRMAMAHGGLDIRA